MGLSAELRFCTKATANDTVDGPQVDVHSLEEDVTGRVRIRWDYHADPAPEPFTVEPLDAVIKAGATTQFRVSFCSLGERPHGGVLVGSQRVYSPNGTLSVKLWDAPDGTVEARIDGSFHPNAASPIEPPQPLRMNLSVRLPGTGQRRPITRQGSHARAAHLEGSRMLQFRQKQS